MPSKGALAEEERARAFMGRSIYHFLLCIGHILAICSKLTAKEAGKCKDYIFGLLYGPLGKG